MKLSDDFVTLSSSVPGGTLPESAVPVHRDTCGAANWQYTLSSRVSLCTHP